MEESCKTCNARFIASDICLKCDSVHFLGEGKGVSQIKVPKYETAIHYINRYHKTFTALMGNHVAATEKLKFFYQAGNRALLIVPSIVWMNFDLRELISQNSYVKLLHYFDSHMILLQEEGIASGIPLYTNMGQTVQIEMQGEKFKAIRHMDTSLPILKYFVTNQGNHVLVVSGILFPYYLVPHSNPISAFHPFLRLNELPECSRALRLLKDSGLYDEILDEAKKPHTLFVPRNDSFTKEQYKYLQNIGLAELRELMRGHIAPGFVNPERYLIGKDVAFMLPSDTIPTLGATLNVSTAIIGAYFGAWPILQTDEPNPIAVRVCTSLLMSRGSLIVIDRLIYNFPQELQGSLPDFAKFLENQNR